MNKFYIDIRKDNFVPVASSVFPMLGILGTFVAMAISMPNFSASSTDALDSEITVLLSGVGSAFSRFNLRYLSFTFMDLL